MFVSNFDNIPETTERISRILDVRIDRDLLDEYKNGFHPTLLSYEKLESRLEKVPAIQKYLIGALNILNQPCQYYDIFRACRHFFTINIIDHNLSTILKSVKNFDERLLRLKEVTTFDAFDSILYELSVAAQYARQESISEVSFLDLKSDSHPDIQFNLGSKIGFVECKKFDRQSNFAVELRNEISKKVSPAIIEILNQKQSAIIELEFHQDPKTVSSEKIIEESLKSLSKKETVNSKEISVQVKSLRYRKLKDYELFPSAKYFWERYNFKNRGEWQGLVHFMKCRYWTFPENIGTDCASTWLDDVEYECAVKWKVSDEKILWRHRKFAYNLLFKGLEQLQRYGDFSILHTWFERDEAVGHRKKELVDFVERLRKSQRDIFSWIIFNETIFDLSVKGLFDLIEHAHPLSGPNPIVSAPIVTNVFTASDDNILTDGEFGVGPDLPDIDEILPSPETSA